MCHHHGYQIRTVQRVMWTLQRLIYMCVCVCRVGEVIVKIVFTTRKENGNQRCCGGISRESAVIDKQTTDFLQIPDSERIVGFRRQSEIEIS